MTSRQFREIYLWKFTQMCTAVCMVTVYSIVYMYISLADKMYATPSGAVYNKSLPPRKQVGFKSVHYHLCPD